MEDQDVAICCGGGGGGGGLAANISAFAEYFNTLHLQIVFFTKKHNSDIFLSKIPEYVPT